MIFCFDTSGLVEAWVRSYPPDHFPTFWNKLEELIDEGRIISPDEVLRELARRDDELHAWAKRNGMFVPFDEELLLRSTEITNKYRRLIEAKPGRSGADPIVIALASLRKAVVVTDENMSTKANAPKIPNVCVAEKIPHCNVLGFIRRMGWKF